MIQVLRNSVNGNFGWRIGESGRIFQGGVGRVDNGSWEIELELDEPDEALELLTDEDAVALVNAWEHHEELAAPFNVDEFVKKMQSAPFDEKFRFGRQTFIRDSRTNHVCYAFRKKGGTRTWLFPVSPEQMKGLITRTHKLQYQIGGNGASIVKA